MSPSIISPVYGSMIYKCNCHQQHNRNYPPRMYQHIAMVTAVLLAGGGAASVGLIIVHECSTGVVPTDQATAPYYQTQACGD